MRGYYHLQRHLAGDMRTEGHPPIGPFLYHSQTIGVNGMPFGRKNSLRASLCNCRPALKKSSILAISVPAHAAVES